MGAKIRIINEERKCVSSYVCHSKRIVLNYNYVQHNIKKRAQIWALFFSIFSAEYATVLIHPNKYSLRGSTRR
jgi:hypothetical protein